MTSRTTTPFELGGQKSSSTAFPSASWITVALPPAVFFAVLHLSQTTSFRASVAAMVMGGALTLLIASASHAWRCEGLDNDDYAYTTAIVAIALSISFGVAVLAVMLPLV